MKNGTFTHFNEHAIHSADGKHSDDTPESKTNEMNESAILFDIILFFFFLRWRCSRAMISV